MFWATTLPAPSNTKLDPPQFFNLYILKIIKKGLAQGPSGLVCETFGHHVFRHLFFPHPRPNLGSEALSVMWCFYYTCVANYASCFWFLNYFVNNELVVWQFGGYERTWYLWWKPSFLIYSLRQYFWMMHGGGALAKQYGQQLRVQYPL